MDIRLRFVVQDSMKEQRGLVQQPLGRFHSFYDYAARERVQTRIFFGIQLLAVNTTTGRSLSDGVSPIFSRTSKPDMSGNRRSSARRSRMAARSGATSPPGQYPQR